MSTQAVWFLCCHTNKIPFFCVYSRLGIRQNETLCVFSSPGLFVCGVGGYRVQPSANIDITLSMCSGYMTVMYMYLTLTSLPPDYWPVELVHALWKLGRLSGCVSTTGLHACIYMYMRVLICLLLPSVERPIQALYMYLCIWTLISLGTRLDVDVGRHSDWKGDTRNRAMTSPGCTVARQIEQCPGPGCTVARQWHTIQGQQCRLCRELRRWHHLYLS